MEMGLVGIVLALYAVLFGNLSSRINELKFRVAALEAEVKSHDNWTKPFEHLPDVYNSPDPEP